LTVEGRAAHVLSAGNDVEATSATIGIGMELSREEVLKGLAEVGYVAEPQLAMAITLMRRLYRSLLLEGEAGVGKAELGKALAAMLGRPLIRLQFYEGLGRRSLQILARRSELGTVRFSVSASGRRADLS
jgi:hypothetical protein